MVKPLRIVLCLVVLVVGARSQEEIFRGSHVTIGDDNRLHFEVPSTTGHYYVY